MQDSGPDCSSTSSAIRSTSATLDPMTLWKMSPSRPTSSTSSTSPASPTAEAPMTLLVRF
jgi:hypothetical protein